MTGQVVPRMQLTDAQREAMFLLLHACFTQVTRDIFAQDLAPKNWVILLTDAQNKLVGFSTLLLYERRIDDAPATIVYSGDTIVAPEAWGSSALSRTWITAVHELVGRRDNQPIYWLLLSSGYRTYRFLPVFFRDFYPRFDRPTPAATQRIMNELAGERFGRNYDPARGIVRLDHPEPLRDDLRQVPPGKLSDPHVAYFLERNPGHSQGDELVCLTNLAEMNLTPAGRRMIASGRARLQPGASPA